MDGWFHHNLAMPPSRMAMIPGSTPEAASPATALPQSWGPGVFDSATVIAAAPIDALETLNPDGAMNRESRERL